jgi:hypothetical protein
MVSFCVLLNFLDVVVFGERGGRSGWIFGIWSGMSLRLVSFSITGWTCA